MVSSKSVDVSDVTIYYCIYRLIVASSFSVMFFDTHHSTSSFNVIQSYTRFLEFCLYSFKIKNYLNNMMFEGCLC